MNLHQELEVVKIPKAKLRKEIKQHVDAFIKKGGVIEMLANNARYDRRDAVSREEWGIR